MSRSLRKRIAGALAVVALAGGSLTMASGEASAASTCNSPPLTGCVQIQNGTYNVRSVRLYVTEPNGHAWTRCLTGTTPLGHISYYPDVWFSGRDAVNTTAYTGGNCEGWSKTDNWHYRWVGPDQNQWWILSAS
ncbi:hypothetical protein GCM10022403_048710 [Streptomyces coacervatus]|uniref:Secreted protein n=1 Tax=Streptomyces coacervatus TaxID=647381 RepID=A0ABP7I3Y8_9ACTN|nr:hypothetical protein [Streptomyces coacervatus]MDF2266282.1 hypothetical protein [Streptomyces coacervatus]